MDSIDRPEGPGPSPARKSPPGGDAEATLSRVGMEQLFYDLWGSTEGPARPAGWLPTPSDEQPR